MRSAAIVKVEISTDRATGLADAFIGSQIDLFVFDTTPQPLNEHVVPPGAFAIHADRNAVLDQYAGEGLSGERRGDRRQVERVIVDVERSEGVRHDLRDDGCVALPVAAEPRYRLRHVFPAPPAAPRLAAWSPTRRTRAL